ncbi:hypothetical protein PRIPAC_74529, partial [Pristionchus pacificus]
VMLLKDEEEVRHLAGCLTGLIAGLLILKGPIVRKRSQRLNNLVFVVFVFAMSIRTRTHPVTGRLQFGFAVPYWLS